MLPVLECSRISIECAKNNNTQNENRTFSKEASFSSGYLYLESTGKIQKIFETCERDLHNLER